jgi:hypothetical protein
MGVCVWTLDHINSPHSDMLECTQCYLGGKRKRFFINASTEPAHWILIRTGVCSTTSMASDFDWILIFNLVMNSTRSLATRITGVFTGSPEMGRLDVDLIIASRYRWRSVRETLSFAGSLSMTTQPFSEQLSSALYRIACTCVLQNTAWLPDVG